MWRVITALTPPIVWGAIRRLRAPQAPAPTTRRGLNGLDDRLEPFLDLSQPGYFVELGANDGIDQSNTLFLEREFGWRGLLIEPSLNRYLDLIKNRADAGNAFACAACVDFDYEGPFVRMVYANLMTVAAGLDTDLTDLRAHLQSAEQFLPSEQATVEYGAVARTLQSLLDQHAAPASVDLLSLDVEGAELAVLKGVDHNRTRFRHLLVECRDITRLSSYLESVGYERLAELSGHDYLFRDVVSRQSD